MDATIVGTGYDPRDSLLFYGPEQESLPVLSLREVRYDGENGIGRASEVRIHLTTLNSGQLNSFIASTEDMLEACHERLAVVMMTEHEATEPPWPRAGICPRCGSPDGEYDETCPECDPDG